MQTTEKRSLTDKERELMQDPERWIPSQGEKITNNYKTVGTLARSGRFAAIKNETDGAWKWSGFNLPETVVEDLTRKAKWIDIIYEKTDDERILFRTTPSKMLQHAEEKNNGDIHLKQEDFIYAYNSKKEKFLSETDRSSKGQQGIGDFG